MSATARDRAPVGEDVREIARLRAERDAALSRAERAEARVVELREDEPDVEVLRAAVAEAERERDALRARVAALAEAGTGLVHLVAHQTGCCYERDQPCCCTRASLLAAWRAALGDEAPGGFTDRCARGVPGGARGVAGSTNQTQTTSES